VEQKMLEGWGAKGKYTWFPPTGVLC
jgi:hypothetical protein